MGIRRNTLILSTLALGAAACGTADGDGDSLVEFDPVVEQPAAPDAAAAGGVTLAAAFETTAVAQAYRAEMALGMNMSMGGGEFSMSFSADPTHPMMLVDVDAEGEQHLRIDMSNMMHSIMAAEGLSAAEVDELLGDMTMEMWLSGTEMTLDVSGFGELLGASTGGAAVFPAEVFTIDTDRLGEGIGANDLASVMAGQATPDPAELAVTLGEVLGDVDVTGGAFAGTIGFLDYSRAFGQDPEALLGSDMGALFEQAGADDMIGAMLEVFETMDVDVSGTIAGGAVDTLRFDMDLSAIWDALPTMMEAAGENMSAADLAEFREMTEDGVFDMTMLIDYDLDPTVDVTVPDGDYPDATDQWISLFGAFTG